MSRNKTYAEAVKLLQTTDLTIAGMSNTLTAVKSDEGFVAYSEKAVDGQVEFEFTSAEAAADFMLATAGRKASISR